MKAKFLLTTLAILLYSAPETFAILLYLDPQLQTAVSSETTISRGIILDPDHEIVGGGKQIGITVFGKFAVGGGVLRPGIQLRTILRKTNNSSGKQQIVNYLLILRGNELLALKDNPMRTIKLGAFDAEGTLILDPRISISFQALAPTGRALNLNQPRLAYSLLFDVIQNSHDGNARHQPPQKQITH